MESPISTISSPSATLIGKQSITAHSVQDSVENGLRVYFFNANSLRSRFETLRIFLAKRQFFHLIAICETKLGSIVDDSIVALPEYSILRQDRRTSGGGVALYVHKSLSVTRLCSSTGEWAARPGLPEYLFCEVSSGSRPPIFVGVVYRPPHAPFMRGTNFIPDLVDHMHNYSSKIIMGDFNSDPRSNHSDAEFLSNFVAENSLFSIPLGTTYHRENVDSELDLCMVDSNDIVCDFWKSDVPFSDGHDMITVTIIFNST